MKVYLKLECETEFVTAAETSTKFLDTFRRKRKQHKSKHHTSVGNTGTGTLVRHVKQNDDDASKKDEKRSGEEWGKTMNRLLHKIISLTTNTE